MKVEQNAVDVDGVVVTTVHPAVDNVADKGHVAGKELIKSV